ncbi:OmpA family protein [Bradyrhizobium cenepequi]
MRLGALTKIGEDAANELAEFLRTQKPNVITVVGHTDHVGGEAYNLDLSKRRAAAVVEFLKGQNISARMTAVERDSPNRESCRKTRPTPRPRSTS